MTRSPDQHAEWTGESVRFVRYTSLCFIVLSLILGLRQWVAVAPSDRWVIHSAMLADLVAEMPIGRQALVSSLSAMPLPSLMALPFLPFLTPAAYGYAYLYGLALLLALAAIPLQAILRRAGVARAPVLAPLALAMAAFGLGATEWSDLLACLAMLILAVYFEIQEKPELRAMAGIFWALTFFAHLAGAVLVVGRLAAMILARIRRPGDREMRAIHWIQGVSIAYVFGVYVFLNWMIMGSPVYPFVTSSWRFPQGGASAARQELCGILAKQYSDCRPVVSGLWGYTLQSLVFASDGYHFIDFKPGKLPPTETGSFVLVIPAAGNPFSGMSDMTPESITRNAKAYASAAGATNGTWFFVRIDMATESDPEDE